MMASTSFATAAGTRSLRLPVVSRSNAPTVCRARAQQQRSSQRAVGVCSVSREGLEVEGACSSGAPSAAPHQEMPQAAMEQPGAMMMLKASLMDLDGAAGAGMFTAAALVAFGLLAMAEPAMALPHADHLASDGAQRVLGDLAEGEEPLLSNVARYGRYFVTVMLGTGYVMARPVVAMFKNPVSGILALIAIGVSVVGTKVTIEAMLGMSNIPATPYDW
ncbi:hypothetical protein FOA52_010862 [Chlamydomonas sp. UWO 241]|nr:hypothetical protein FOA52_010862 [Chlamydomonas sp. UWO 241]